ncbi:MAG: hypothetical protein ACE5GW_12250, partial [Planctomycetota bacterium]
GRIEEDDEHTIRILDDQDQGPVIRLVNKLIFDGYRMRASDIHFQPLEERLQVRYRIDGILYSKEEILSMLKAFAEPRIELEERILGPDLEHRYSRWYVEARKG